MIEEWKNVIGFEKYYKISNKGRLNLFFSFLALDNHFRIKLRIY